jgi:ComF family protein
VLIRLLGDLLSPPRCAACESTVTRQRVFCAPCAASVERCTGEPASLCAGPDARNIDEPRVHVAFGYYGGALATAIRRLKYEDRPYLARPLGELLRGACRAAEARADVVIPVPLHLRRLAERGYNQSALLAAHVARELRAPLRTSVLTRTVDTVPQVELDGDSRRQNVENAFVVNAPASLRGRAVALVDDVSTTGATLRACGRALRAAGAELVMGFTLACTPPSGLRIPLRLDAAAVLDVGIGGA